MTPSAFAETKTPGSPSQGQSTNGVTPEDPTFAIHDYFVEGNTLIRQAKVDEILSKYTGQGLRIVDIEKARLALEKTYHDMGYPTVFVTIPQQTIEDNIVRLHVIETNIGNVSVTGNRYFSDENILSKLPSLRPGRLLYEPNVQKELDLINANPDRQVTPVLKPGKDADTADLELKVKDRLPLHGRLEGDNRGTSDTPRGRLNASLQYANLFNRENILTLQTTQTPDDWGAIQVYSFSYVAPVKWPDHLLPPATSPLQSLLWSPVISGCPVYRTPYHYRLGD